MTINFVLFFVVVLFLSRQVPFNNYSYIMNVFSGLFLINNFIKIKKIDKIMIFNFISIIILFLYSFLKENNLDLIVRFFLILMFLNLSFFVKGEKKYLDIFIIFQVIQIIFLIIFEIYIIQNYNINNYLPIRHYFREMGWGDVYTFNGNFWKIQIKGNALLPFFFFLSWYYFTGIKRKIVLILSGVSIFIAGNFAYILGVGLFLTGIYINHNRKKISKLIIAILFTISLIVASFPYVEKQYQLKSESSNPTKVDQAKVLIEDMSYKNIDFLLGKGLGNTIDKKTKYRNYADNIYYEFQWIYFFNQIGLIFSCLLLIMHMILIKKYMKYARVMYIYSCYIFYSLFNPYFLDTNHIVVIIVLISLTKLIGEKNEKNNCNNSYI